MKTNNPDSIMITHSSLTEPKRTLSITKIDFRIKAGMRDLRYKIKVGNDVLEINEEELKKIAEISQSYFQSEKGGEL